jgi:hypothetical protein
MSDNQPLSDVSPVVPLVLPADVALLRKSGMRDTVTTKAIAPIIVHPKQNTSTGAHFCIFLETNEQREVSWISFRTSIMITYACLACCGPIRAFSE